MKRNLHTCLIAVLVGVLLIAGCASGPPKAEQPSTPSAVQPEEEIAVADIEETVICDQNGIVVTAKGLSYGDLFGPELKIVAENKTNRTVTIQARDVSVNDYMVSVIFSCDVAPGKSAVDEITFQNSSLELIGIETFGKIELKLHVFDADSFGDLFDTDVIVLHTTAYEHIEPPSVPEGIKVYEGNGIRISALGLTDEPDWLGRSLYFHVENDTDRDIVVQVREVSVNGFMVDTIMSSTVAAGKKMVDDLLIMESSLEEAGIQTVENVEFYFHIFDDDTWEAIADTDVIVLEF